MWVMATRLFYLSKLCTGHRGAQTCLQIWTQKHTQTSQKKKIKKEHLGHDGRKGQVPPQPHPLLVLDALGHRAHSLPERYDWTFSLCSYSWHRQAFGNCTQERGAKEFPLSFLMMSHKEMVCLRSCLKKNPQRCLQLAQLLMNQSEEKIPSHPYVGIAKVIKEHIIGQILKMKKVKTFLEKLCFWHSVKNKLNDVHYSNWPHMICFVWFSVKLWELEVMYLFTVHTNCIYLSMKTLQYACFTTAWFPQ